MQGDKNALSVRVGPDSGREDCQRNAGGSPAALALRLGVRYRLRVAAPTILSEETARRLIEAYASLAAWYYQMADALRTSGTNVSAPSDAQRQAYLAQIATEFPELAAVAGTISSPQPYVPPPVVAAPASVVENEGVSSPGPPPEPPPEAGPAPPPMVDPNKVKYD